MPKPKIYALLVGIDKYKAPVPPLEGCVNDMIAVKQFLESRTNADDYELDLAFLMDADATRLNIVYKFETHLARATENDIVFFYYSGHGSQEHAHEVFWTLEEDRMNETLVCYDSRSADGMDLADKELATLIELVSQKNPHIIIIQDCCNSGSGTRGDAVVRAVRDVPPRTRSLDSYILPRNFDADRSVLATSEEKQLIIPEGRHIHLSAAQSFQLAKETQLGGTRRGVFTYSLLEVLQNAQGPLSYGDVIRRVRGLVTKRTYDQSPQIFASHASDMDKVFLDGSATTAADYYSMTYDRAKGWSIDAGAVHGIVAGRPGGESTVLTLFPDSASVEEMKDESRSLGEATVSQVNPSNSVVLPRTSPPLKTDQAYRVRVVSTPVDPLQVFFTGTDADGISTAIRVFAETETPYLEAVGNLGECDYKVVAKAGLGYLITRKADGDDQPLVEQILGFSDASAAKLVEYLEHIAHWERTLDLTNPASSIFSEAVRIELYPPEGNTPIFAGPNGIEFSYSAADLPDNLPGFRVKVVNTSHQRLYCALLYMSSQFEVNVGLMAGGGLWLDPGAEAWAVSGQVIRAKIADELLAFGKNLASEYFKVIVSTDEYDATLLRQEQLGLPRPAYRSVGGSAPSNTRSFVFSGNTSQRAASDWNATELMVSVRRTDGSV